ncbi:PAC2 family protein [Candidatus Woesearchaeota archaeon]|nr:PAC2 family protein [Candidatus Woesearchaeota archaeon]
MTWKFEDMSKNVPKLDKTVLIVGLPGIGNVGKIAADFIIDEVKAKPIYNIFSHELPNSVFVNDQNLVELPSVEMYLRKRKGNSDILILTGDVQPADETSSYDFCEGVLDRVQKLGVEMVITLGGIGLAEVPKKPQVFCTGNSKEIIAKFSRKMKLNEKLYGIVGPIIGVSGLLVGLAGRKGMPAVCLLAETLGHPAYLGIKGAREIVKVLNSRLDLKIRISELDKEIEDIEGEILTRTQELGKASKKTALKKLQGRMHKETNYIG